MTVNGWVEITETVIMSLAAESPSPSSSNEDFAAFLDIELQSSPSYTLPVNEQSEEENQSEYIEDRNVCKDSSNNAAEVKEESSACEEMVAERSRV